MAQRPATRTMNITDVETDLTGVVDSVQGRNARVLIERAGAPVAALISADDLAWFALLEQQRDDRFKILDEMQAAFAGVSEEEIERDVAKALAEVREEMRAEREQERLLGVAS